MRVVHGVPIDNVGATLVACQVRSGDFLADQLASLALVLDGGLADGTRKCFLVGKRLAKRQPPALKSLSLNTVS